MQSQKRQNDLCVSPRQTIQYHSYPSLSPNQQWWRSWSWMVLWRPTRLCRTNTQKRCPFHYRGLECKSRKSRNTWLLLLLSHFSYVWLCATPQMAAHQAPPSLGFSRQEHWSGLPFPSPMHESEKWKWSPSVESDSSQPHGLQPTRLLHPWDFPGKSTGMGCHRLLPRWISKDI